MQMRANHVPNKLKPAIVKKNVRRGVVGNTLFVLSKGGRRLVVDVSGKGRWPRVSLANKMSCSICLDWNE